MHAYPRQQRSLSTIISADQWAGIEDDATFDVQQQLPDDLDYALAMPELYRCQRLEQQAADDNAIEDVEEVTPSSSGKDSGSSGLRRSRRISERLVDLGRKARGSIATLMGRKDSLLREELATREDWSQSKHGLVTGPFYTQAEPATWPLSSFESEQLDDVSLEEATDYPLDTMHLHEGDSSRPSLHLTQAEAGELLAARLGTGVARGDFEDDVRDAYFAARHVEATEEQKWEASYDLMRASAERRKLADESFRNGTVPVLDANEDVNLGDLRCEVPLTL